MRRSKKIISSGSISVGERVELSSFDSALNLQQKAYDLEKHLSQVESQHNQILEKLEIEKNKIIEDTKNLSEKIERDAYEKGYKEGQANGYEDGYREAYDETLEKARFESEEMLQEATKTLLQANSLVESYMKENKANIINLSLAIAEKVLKDKFEEVDSMNKIVEDMIFKCGQKKSIVVKVNPLYKEELDLKIEELKETNNISDNIFVLGHEKIDKGNVIIETEKGVLTSGMESVLDLLREELR